jgi:hypothetical protein
MSTFFNIFYSNLGIIAPHVSVVDDFRTGDSSPSKRGGVFTWERGSEISDRLSIPEPWSLKRYTIAVLSDDIRTILLIIFIMVLILNNYNIVENVTSSIPLFTR